ncbi:hypothetical protein GUITHDRAFT_117077 [Guillardia theta CCMP2712]|uniref:PDZ domain-containing protein n=1 Tax=Guillardia theta (strain CCMP2712) TaxID=905079 RepID=L1ILX6_GUITC|nr:hypothetical protein GUITHDRAFT_117077 [Guillardia theta CCMP2712]EKX36780.1 hypothetical protein GUITHDRAFT_117077 [Guillardia theta CCMP2712]|eukprot:XP_005823760.1 hypothetical protein GUITHDRAFT_117077 [Guillardia theta CCMP2712]
MSEEEGSRVEMQCRRLIVGLDIEPSIGSRVSTSVGSSRQNHGTIVSIDGDRVKVCWDGGNIDNRKLSSHELSAVDASEKIYFRTRDHLKQTVLTDKTTPNDIALELIQDLEDAENRASQLRVASASHSYRKTEETVTLQERIRDLERELEDKEELLLRAREELKEEKEKQQELLTKVKGAQTSRKGLEEQLEAEMESAVRMRAKWEEEKKKRSRQEERVEECMAIKTELDKTCNDQKKLIRELNLQIDDEKHKYKLLAQQQQKMLQDVEALKNERDLALASSTELEIKLRNMTSEKNSLDEKYNSIKISMEKEVRNLRQSLLKFETENHALQAVNEESTIMIKKYKEQISLLELRISELFDSSITMKKKIEEIQTLEMRIKVITEQYKMELSAHDALKSEVLTLRTNMVELQTHFVGLVMLVDWCKANFHLSEEMGGVGMIVGKYPQGGSAGRYPDGSDRAGHIYVLRIFPDGPADLSRKIELNDRIHLVDDLVVDDDHSIEDVFRHIRGKPGTQVTLTLGRFNSSNTEDRFRVTLTRRPRSSYHPDSH